MSNDGGDGSEIPGFFLGEDTPEYIFFKFDLVADYFSKIFIYRRKFYSPFPFYESVEKIKITLTQLIKIAILIALAFFLLPLPERRINEAPRSPSAEEYREERKAAGNGFGETEREDPYFFLTPVLG